MYMTISPTLMPPGDDDTTPRMINPAANINNNTAACLKRKQSHIVKAAEDTASLSDEGSNCKHDTPLSSSASQRHEEAEPSFRPAKRQRLDFGDQSFLQAILNDDAGEPASQSRRPAPYAASPSNGPCLSEAFSDTGSLTWEHGLSSSHQLFASKQPASPPLISEESCWGLPPVHHYHPHHQSPPHYAVTCRQHIGASYPPYSGSTSRIPAVNPPSFYNPRASFYASSGTYSPADGSDSDPFPSSSAYCCQQQPPSSSTPLPHNHARNSLTRASDEEFLDNLDTEHMTDAEMQRNLKKITACLARVPGLEKIRWQSILQGTRSPEVGDRETQRRVKEAEIIGTRLFGGDVNKLFTSLLNQNIDFLVSYVANLHKGKKKHRKLRTRLLRELKENGSEESSDN